jgi:hypothetical protein
MITELLFDRSDLEGALDWATAGVELILQGAGQTPPEAASGAVPPQAQGYTGLRELLQLRYRIRNDMRLPEDEYDRMLGA